MDQKCVMCGKECSATLARKLTNKYRLCAECWQELCVVPVGTKIVNSLGYILVKCEDGEWRLEHRIVAEEKIGRKLLPGEQVHHIDQNKGNNDPDNLEVCKSFREHLENHHAADLVNPPTHRNGRRRKGDPGYIPIPRRT
jgi:hypothetical protein